MRFTLFKKNLFKKADFSLLFKEGRKKYGSFFILYFRRIQNPIAVIPAEAGIQANGMSIKQFGLVVGKKATITNVKRNLVKRVIRESYRHAQHDLAGFQVLVVAKKGLKPIESKVLRADLDAVFLQLHA